MVDDDEAQPGDVVIEAEGVEFPERVEARAGRIGLLVDNSDAVRHTFLIEGTDVKEELPRNAARRIDVDLAQGEYRIYCDVPGHESMEGTLVVEWGRLTWPPRPTLR